MIGEIQTVPSRPAEAGAQASSELRKIAGEFETVFSKMLLASMRKTVQKTPLFHAGRGEEIFSELLDNNYSAALSKIHSSVERLLLKNPGPRSCQAGTKFALTKAATRASENVTVLSRSPAAQQPSLLRSPTSW